MVISDQAVDLPPSMPDSASQDAMRAYESCLSLHNAMHEPEQKKERIAARVLAYFLLNPLGDNVDADLVRDINACTDEAALVEVGMMWWDSMLRVFRTNRMPSLPLTPDDLHCAGRQEYRRTTFLTTTTGKTLIRDGFRCVLSGDYDCQAVEAGSVTPPASEEQNVKYTELCHILPHGLVRRLEIPDERDESASMDFDGSLVDGLENAFTATLDCHCLFNNLGCYLEETATPDVYQLKVVRSYMKNRERVVDLRSDNALFTRPSAKLLAIHRTCAIVAHLSGAGRWMNTHPEEDEEDPLVWSGAVHFEPVHRDAFAKALSGRLRANGGG